MLRPMQEVEPPEPEQPPVEPPEPPEEAGEMPEHIAAIFAADDADQVRERRSEDLVVIWDRPSG